MARHAATTPPTGMVPTGPAGQASGITAPATTVGVRMSPCIVRRTCSTLSASSGVVAAMFSCQASGSARKGTVGGSWNVST